MSLAPIVLRPEKNKDETLTCFVCSRERCELSVTARSSTSTVALGLHQKCYERTIGRTSSTQQFAAVQAFKSATEKLPNQTQNAVGGFIDERGEVNRSGKVEK